MKQVHPHKVSGAIRLAASTTFGELVAALVGSEWCMDGYQPEPAEMTIGQLLERRQPRPIHWGCGLLPSRVSRIEAVRGDSSRYMSVAAPRKASGPDLAYLFIGGEGRFGHIESAEINLLRSARSYVVGTGRVDSPEALFEIAKAIALHDPAATRHIDLAGLSVRAYLPVRQADSTHLAEMIDGWGLDVSETVDVPQEAHFRDLESDPSLRVSGNYTALLDALEIIRKAKGKKKTVERALYTDCHGANLYVGFAKSSASSFEKLLPSIMKLKGIDYCWSPSTTDAVGPEFTPLQGGPS